MFFFKEQRIKIRVKNERFKMVNGTKVPNLKIYTILTCTLKFFTYNEITLKFFMSFYSPLFLLLSLFSTPLPSFTKPTMIFSGLK